MHVLFQFNDIFDAMMYFVYQLSGILMWRAIPHSLNIIYRYRLTQNLSSNIQDNVMLVDLFHYSTYATNIKQHDVSQFAPDKILLSYYDSFLYSSCIFMDIQFIHSYLYLTPTNTMTCRIKLTTQVSSNQWDERRVGFWCICGMIWSYHLFIFY